MKDTTIAVGLAKNVFEIAISREAGKVSKQLRVSRPKLVSFFAKQSAATASTSSRRSLATYTESGGTGKTALDQAEAVAVMLEKYEVCHGLFHSFDYSGWIDGTPAERVGLLPAAQEHILAQENGKERCLQAVRELSQAFALAVPHEDAIRIRDDVAFFQAVRSVLAKRAEGEARPEQELDYAVRQIVSRAVASEGVVNIFAAAGLEKPDISILSEELIL